MIIFNLPKFREVKWLPKSQSYKEMKLEFESKSFCIETIFSFQYVAYTYMTFMTIINQYYTKTNN